MANVGNDSAGDGKNILSYEERQAIVTDRLAKRNEDRLDGISKRRDEKEKVSSSEENIEVFSENFSAIRKIVEDGLAKCDVIPKNELSSQFDYVAKAIQNLQKVVTDSALFLSSYEVRTSQEVVAKFNQCLQDKRESLLPKKKFAFKSKKKVENSANKDGLVINTKGYKEQPGVALTDCGFKNINSQQLKLCGVEIESKDIALSNLTDCVVKLEGAPCAIHIDKLTNCTVFSGPVAGSIFVDDCVGTTFVVACQQLRIHTTTKSKFYIHVTSRAIIEDCSAVEFAPYNWCYVNLEKDLKFSGLDKSRNNWDNVDDFNWLAKDKRSPNWNVMDESMRVSKWD